MAIITFNYPSEFIDELRKEPLAKPVVRCTNNYRMSEKVAPLRYLTVVATAKTADGDIIRLDHPCGQLWGTGAEDDKTNEHAEAVFKQLTEACQELKLELRAGIYE